jgi:pentatricopeptide repeat protein
MCICTSVGLFHAIKGIANQVTYNTLIEALGVGGQFTLVDELYKEAIDNNIVNPLSEFRKGVCTYM